MMRFTKKRKKTEKYLNRQRTTKRNQNKPIDVNVYTRTLKHSHRHLLCINTGKQNWIEFLYKKKRKQTNKKRGVPGTECALRSNTEQKCKTNKFIFFLWVRETNRSKNFVRETIETKGEREIRNGDVCKGERE